MATLTVTGKTNGGRKGIDMVEGEKKPRLFSQKQLHELGRKSKVYFGVLMQYLVYFGWIPFEILTAVVRRIPYRKG